MLWIDVFDPFDRRQQYRKKSGDENDDDRRQITDSESEHDKRRPCHRRNRPWQLYDRLYDRLNPPAPPQKFTENDRQRTSQDVADAETANAVFYMNEQCSIFDQFHERAKYGDRPGKQRFVEIAEKDDGLPNEDDKSDADGKLEQFMIHFLPSPR